MPERPRHTQDNFYRKGAFHVLMDVAGPVDDEEALHEAVMAFLTALHAETDLKVSSFFDIVDVAEPDDPDSLVETDTQSTATIEFVIYNKLGVTALGKLRRFFADHINEKMRVPRATLYGGGETYKADNFQIQYLFVLFTYRKEPDSWDKLRELLGQDDRGYREVMARRPHEESSVKAATFLAGVRYIDIAAACGDRVFVGVPPRSDTTDTQTEPGEAIHVAVLPYIDALLAEKRAGDPVYVLDYGSGRFARHANHVRRVFGDDARVYAYDPFKDNGQDPWADGGVSNRLPTEQRFDLVFSAYVLNVVTDAEEDAILAEAESLGGTQVHIVRDDLRGEVRKWFHKGNQDLIDWYMEEFATPEERKEFVATDGRVSLPTLVEFVCFGFPTSKGFQRQPALDQKGYHKDAGASAAGNWVTWVASV